MGTTERERVSHCPGSLQQLAVELRDRGFANRISPDRRAVDLNSDFHARLDEEEGQVVAWCDDERLGWLGRFPDTSALADDLRRVRRVLSVMRIGAACMGFATFLFLVVVTLRGLDVEFSKLLLVYGLTVVCFLAGGLLRIWARAERKRIRKRGTGVVWDLEEPDS